MRQEINELLEKIYNQYQKPLRVLVRSYGVPSKYVEDIVQETIISYYQHYPLDWPPKLMKTLLGIILRNKSVDYFRKNNREWLILDSDEFIEDEELAVRYGKDMLDQIINKELYVDVENAFAQLKEEMKIPTKLHLIDGIQEKVIAEMMGISAVACRARVRNTGCSNPGCFYFLSAVSQMPWLHGHLTYLTYQGSPLYYRAF